MKKKILALCVVVSLSAVAIIGGTLAYFTDTDTATNVFTTGKVDIALEEKFNADNAKLLPGKQNAIQKEVSIKLEDGSEDAYVWYTFAIPSSLDSIDGSTGLNNIVHVNSSGATWDKYWDSEKYQVPQNTKVPASIADTWDHDPNVELNGLVGPEGFIGTKTIGDIEYNIYLVLYHGKMTNDTKVDEDGNTTTVAMTQVYLDAGVDTKTVDGKTVYIDKNGKEISYDFSKNINIIVNAYAIQADGFADVYEAYKSNPVKL